MGKGQAVGTGRSVIWGLGTAWEPGAPWGQGTEDTSMWQRGDEEGGGHECPQGTSCHRL